MHANSLIAGEMSNILQKAVIPPVSHTSCNEQFGNRAFKEIIMSQICAGDGTGKDTCQVINNTLMLLRKKIMFNAYLFFIA